MKKMSACHYGRVRVEAIAAVAVLTLAALSGCQSTYVSGYDYTPRPVDVAIGDDGRLVMSLVGLRQAEKDVRGRAIEVTLRMENQGEKPMTLYGGGLSMMSANLVELSEAELLPGSPITVPPGESTKATALFVLPADKSQKPPDLDGLSLRATVLIDGQPFTQTTTFTRMQPVSPRSNVGFGVGIGVGL